jgi:hypothetical protein
VLAFSDGRFQLVWQSLAQDWSGNGVFARTYTAAGDPESSEFQVNTMTLYHQSLPRAAVRPDGSVIYVWMSLYQDGSGYGVFGQVLPAGYVPEE